MSSLEVNKTFAAILTAGITFSLAGFIGSQLVHPERLHEAAIQIGDVGAPAAAPAAAPTIEPIAPLLASANVERGQQVAQRLCGSCHTWTDGGRSGVGPNLYGIVGAPHAHAQGFSYSGVLQGKHSDPWTYEELNHWLFKPSTYAPGTRMAFAGISGAQQRADVIAYLQTLK